MISCDDLLDDLPVLLSDEDLAAEGKEEQSRAQFDDVETFQPIIKPTLKVFSSFKPGKDDPILCWHCKSSFDTLPVGCPTHFNRNRLVCHTEGCFCSYECAAAYGTELSRRSAVRFPVAWLVRLRKHFDGTPLSKPLKPALHFSVLKEFGGHLSIEEFRSASQSSVCLRTMPDRLTIVPFGYSVFEARKSRRVSRRSFQSSDHKKRSMRRGPSRGSKASIRANNNSKRISKLLAKVRVRKVKKVRKPVRLQHAKRSSIIL